MSRLSTEAVLTTAEPELKRPAFVVRPAGGADPDTARRSGPLAVTSSTASPAMTAWSWCWRARQWDTAGTAFGRSPWGAVRGSRHAWGASAQKARRKAAAPQRRDPRLNPGRLRRVTLAAFPPQLLASVLAVHGWGRQARRAEGAPLKVVEKVVTTWRWRMSVALADVRSVLRLGPC